MSVNPRILNLGSVVGLENKFKMILSKQKQDTTPIFSGFHNLILIFMAIKTICKGSIINFETTKDVKQFGGCVQFNDLL